MRSAAQGDKEAFGELVLMHQRAVHGLAYRLCGDAALADDATQETFLRAWQALPTYDHRGSLRNWLLRIVANIVTDQLRRQSPVALDAETMPAGEGSPSETAERNALQAQVRQAIMALPPASRAALVLREFDGLSYTEIAEVLGVPVGTVMSRLHYARQTLRRVLALEMEEG